MSSDRLVHPLLFPCAAKVKIPQVGADESGLRANKARLTDIPIGKMPEAPGHLTRGYLKKISADLSFSEDVVEQRGAHTLPYDEKKLLTAYNFSGICKSPRKTHIIIGRHNTRGPDRKHLPCNLKKRHHHLMPLEPKKKEKRKSREEEKGDEEEDRSYSDEEVEIIDRFKIGTERASEFGSPIGSPEAEDVFLTEATLAAKECAAKSVKEAMKWEEYLLLSLSKNTARWIVSEKSGGQQQDKLAKFLVEEYGEATHPTDTLLRDDASVSDLGVSSEHDLLSRVSKSRQKDQHSEKGGKELVLNDMGEPFDPDDLTHRPLVSFYRLPGGLRRQHKELERELSGAINTTATDIEVNPQKPPPPKTLKDFINPAVGDKVYMTGNQFEQEWLTGAKQVYQPDKDKTQIVLDTGNKYKVAYIENYPQAPDKWHQEDKSKDKKKKKKKVTPTKETNKVIIGMTKWSHLPEPDDSDRRGLAIQDTSLDADLNKEPDAKAIRKTRENPALTKIGSLPMFNLVDGWRNKWHLGNRWNDSSIDDLVQDMNDINDHVRLTAIATIARAATFRPPPEPGIQLRGAPSAVKQEEKAQPFQGLLPDKLLACVKKALYDTSKKVQITAAIALYTLCKVNEEAKRILNDTLRNGDEPERWAAAQCLAHAGVGDSFVVAELIQQIFCSDDSIQCEQAMSLLTNLSEQTSIVHAMVAEQLNSTSWKNRVIACRILPRLHGQINRDLTNKLSDLMWNDWHQDVRKMAAQTLGRTGHGKEVHNDLKTRLDNGSERERVDALTKIGHLGIMTAKLMPSYLMCFDDEYISVRKAVASTAGYLRIKDQQIIRKLLFLTQFDSSWKVKAHAIKALGMIGLLTDDIGDAILWALRFETSPGVRAEACHTLVLLGMHGDNVTHMLQDRLLVEPDEVVRYEVAIALQSLGVSPTGDMDMVQAIKSEVRRLNTRYNIASKITENEKIAKREELHERFFNVPRELGSPTVFETDKSIAGSRASTRLSLRTMTPGVHISSEEDDFSLPKSPVSEARDRRYLSPTPPPKTPGRRTPEEKLEKLIDVYDGVISMKEYKDYVEVPETTSQEDATLQRKLEDIPETEQEEEGKPEIKEDNVEGQEGIEKEDRETQTTPTTERELKDTSAYHDTIDPRVGESTAEGTEVIDMKHVSPGPGEQETDQTEEGTSDHAPDSSDQAKEGTDVSGQSDTSDESPRPAAHVSVPPTVEETDDDDDDDAAPEPQVVDEAEEDEQSDADTGDSDDSSDG
ncbi:HEAT repeat-containing protein 4-like isoform X2 [Glandiceps talaboti]